MMFVFSMLIFGTIGIFRRFIPLSSAVIACFRGISGAAFLLVFMAAAKKPLRHGLPAGKVLALAFTGVLIGFNWILLFEAYRFTTVATATLCYYTEPTIVLLLSPLFFREKLTGRKLVCAALAVAGMVLISGITENAARSPENGKGILLGLGAAVLYSSVVIANKKLSGIDAYEKTVIELAAAGVVLLPYIFLKEEISVAGWSATGVVMLAVVGIVNTGLAYILYFGSMDGLKMQSMAILSYLDPVTALLLSALLLSEPVTVPGGIGALLILAAGILGELPKKRNLQT